MKKIITITSLCLLILSTAWSQEKVTVYFESNSSELTDNIKSALDNIIAQKDQIASDPGISIDGHTDILGDHNFNDVLSRWRMKAVRDYLTLHGVKSELIKNTNGYGKRKPVNKNKTDEQKAMNRRVEITYKLS